MNEQLDRLDLPAENLQHPRQPAGLLTGQETDDETRLGRDRGATGRFYCRIGLRQDLAGMLKEHVPGRRQANAGIALMTRSPPQGRGGWETISVSMR